MGHDVQPEAKPPASKLPKVFQYSRIMAKKSERKDATRQPLNRMAVKLTDLGRNI